MTKWILDPGHGGFAFGHYCTKGKQSPEVPPGIYEGVFNRQVAWNVGLHMLRERKQEVVVTAPSAINVPLKTRVEFVNSLPFDDMALISIHANAAGNSGWSEASGARVFTPRMADTQTKVLAGLLEQFIDIATQDGSLPYGRRARGRADFTVIHKVRCPAILVECGFMTNMDDARFLASERGIKTWVNILTLVMTGYEELHARAKSHT